MAGTIGTITGVGFGKSGATVMGRILGTLGIPITQASLSTIQANVYDTVAGVSTYNAFLTINQVVFDSLVVADPRWDVDSANLPGRDGRFGYNFLATIPATAFQTAFDASPVTLQLSAHPMEIDVTFTPVSGQVFVQKWRFTPIPVWP